MKKNKMFKNMGENIPSEKFLWGILRGEGGGGGGGGGWGLRIDGWKFSGC